MVEQVGHDVGAEIAEFGERGELRGEPATAAADVDDEIIVGETERAQERALEFADRNEFAAAGSLDSGVIRQCGTQLREMGGIAFQEIYFSHQK